MRLELFHKNREQLKELCLFYNKIKCDKVLFTNKSKDDDPVGDAAFFLKNSTNKKIDVTTVFAVKAQWRGGNKGKSAEDIAYDRWIDFYGKAANANIARVLIVSGNPKKSFNSLHFLQRHAKEQPKPTKKQPKIGIAFSPYILDKDGKMEERERLTAKLETGLVEDIWLQFGGDAKRLREELTWLTKTHPNYTLYGSMFVPTPQWLARFRFRPWNGIEKITRTEVDFLQILMQNHVFQISALQILMFFCKGIILPNGFLDSLEAAQAGCKAILNVYQEFDVQVLIESPTRSEKDYASVRAFLGEQSSKPL